MELDRSTIFLAFIGEKYCPRVPDVSLLVATRPWIEALQDKSIVEIEVAAALLVNPSKFESRSFVYIREGSFLDSLVGLSTGDYIEKDPVDELAMQAFKKRLRTIENAKIVDGYPGPDQVILDPSRIAPQAATDYMWYANVCSGPSDCAARSAALRHAHVPKADARALAHTTGPEPSPPLLGPVSKLRDACCRAACPACTKHPRLSQLLLRLCSVRQCCTYVAIPFHSFNSMLTSPSASTGARPLCGGARVL